MPMSPEEKAKSALRGIKMLDEQKSPYLSKAQNERTFPQMNQDLSNWIINQLQPVTGRPTMAQEAALRDQAALAPISVHGGSQLAPPPVAQPLEPTAPPSWVQILDPFYPLLLSRQ
jgi:hypothetical protein